MKKRAHLGSVTYVDVDTVATAHGNIDVIVTISAPPFPSALGEGGGADIGGWGPTEHNRRLVLNWDRQKVPKLQLFLLFPLH